MVGAAAELRWAFTDSETTPHNRVRIQKMGNAQHNKSMHTYGLFAQRSFSAGDIVLVEEAAARASLGNGPMTATVVAYNLLRSKPPLPPSSTNQVWPVDPSVLGLVASSDVKIQYGEGATQVMKRMSKEIQRDISALQTWSAAVMPYIVSAEGVATGTLSSVNLHFICSMANHSCAPNCVSVFNATGTRQHLVAVTSIAAGQELCVTYWTDLLTDTFHLRQMAITGLQGWTCWCTRCGNERTKLVFTASSPAITCRMDNLYPYAQAVFQKPEDMQCHVFNHIDAISTAFRTPHSEDRCTKLASAARILLVNLDKAGITDKEPSLAWFASSWILRAMQGGGGKLASSFDKPWLVHVCSVLWSSVCGGHASDVPAVRTFTLYWIHNAMQLVNISAKQLPIDLQAAFATREFKSTYKTFSHIEKV